MSLFIDTSVLSNLLTRGEAVPLDVRRFEHFIIGHIPGSTWLSIWDLMRVNEGKPSTPKPRDVIAGILGSIGVGDDDYVVIVYDRSSVYHASYATWFLDYVGHNRYSILRGGFDAWINSNLPIERGPPNIARKIHTVRGGGDVRATIDDVLNVISGVINGIILDIRTWDEHTGNIATTYRAGRIPKSINLEPDVVVRALNGDSGGLERVLKIVGEGRWENTIVYCTTGERASLAWLLLRKVIGLNNVKLFPEGFLEYSKNEKLQVEIGEPKAVSRLKTIRIDKDKLCEYGIASPLRMIIDNIEKMEKGDKLILELNDADWILTLKKIGETKGFKIIESGIIEGFTRLIIEK